MDTRRPASDIINGLTTKSDEISALAQAGYDRTEISKTLGIRDQHVRNVLWDSPRACGLAPRPNVNDRVAEVGRGRGKVCR
jgi:hypothetical protein